MCKISIVLPVYNVAPFIQQTIESLLQQSFQDFELLVLDDCSTDDTVERVRSFVDSRIKLLVNIQNLGRAGTDNAALAFVRGEYIAKMDGDDLCHPERLARQAAYLDGHPDVNVVGSWMQNFGASTYLNRYPSTPNAAQVATLFTLPTGNPSVMMRTQLFREQGMCYDAALRQTEDYDFFARYVRKLRIVTLPEALIQYRVPLDTSKGTILTERATMADEVRSRLLSGWGIICTARELQIHNTIAMLDRPLGDIHLEEIDAWLRKLIYYNDEQPLFEPAALRYGLGERWFEVCYTHSRPLLRGVFQFERSQLANYFPLENSKRIKFWAKSMRQL